MIPMKNDDIFKELFTKPENIKDLINSVLHYSSDDNDENTQIKEIMFVVPQV